MQKLKYMLKTFHSTYLEVKRTQDILIETKLLTAKTLINSFNYNLNIDIQHYEFKIFSQWGDDGIIQYLIHKLDFEHRTFVEFGVENYLEANSKFLLINNNWSGYVLDGSTSNVEQIKNSSLYWKYKLQAKDAFITAENINQLLLESSFGENIGILSIDIDGNDYWIWKTIKIKPIVVIVEYNSVFGAQNPWTIPYQAGFIRNKAHFSNLYYGTSLLSLYNLAQEKGYAFIGCNSAGNNAYFVRKDKLNGLIPKSCEEGFVDAHFRESRNRAQQLTYLSDGARLDAIKGMPVYNTQNHQEEQI